jgi:hypothetical protein
LGGGDIIAPTTVFNADEIVDNLKNYNISDDQFDNFFGRYCINVRDDFLRSQSKIIYKLGLRGHCAEGGVFQGYFARQINVLFPDRKLYLFDTFEGFDVRSLTSDNDISDSYDVSCFNDNDFSLAAFPYPENIVVRKGFFPSTARDISDDFVFVNLDFDLYHPTSDGLEFFYPKMIKGGVILIHDFFNEDFSGVDVAVNEFCEKHCVNYIAIGDNISVAIVK